MYACQALVKPGGFTWDRFIANSVSDKNKYSPCTCLCRVALPHYRTAHSLTSHVTFCMPARPACRRRFTVLKPMHGHLHVTDPCATSVMLPVKPPDVPSDIWELELPSILGAAHPAYREGNGTPPPHSSLSILSSDDGSSPDPELTLNTEDLHQSPPATTQVHPITSADTLFQEWNVAEHQTWLHLDTSTTSRLAAAGPLDPDAEKLATTLLLQDRVSFADLDRLLDLLPEKSSTKRRGPLCGRLPRQKCFSTGAYTFAHATGVQSNTLLYPRATQLLTSVIRA